MKPCAASFSATERSIGSTAADPARRIDLLADGLTLDPAEGSGRHEQHDADDGEPDQPLDDEAENGENDPDDQQDSDECQHGSSMYPCHTATRYDTRIGVPSRLALQSPHPAPGWDSAHRPGSVSAVAVTWQTARPGP